MKSGHGQKNEADTQTMSDFTAWLMFTAFGLVCPAGFYCNILTVRLGDHQRVVNGFYILRSSFLLIPSPLLCLFSSALLS